VLDPGPAAGGRFAICCSRRPLRSSRSALGRDLWTPGLPLLPPSHPLWPWINTAKTLKNRNVGKRNVLYVMLSKILNLNFIIL